MADARTNSNEVRRIVVWWSVVWPTWACNVTCHGRLWVQLDTSQLTILFPAMTRATRFVATATVVSVVYFLFLFGYWAVPILSSETSAKILPTVRLFVAT